METISMRGLNLSDHQNFRNGRRHRSIQLLSASATRRESEQQKIVSCFSNGIRNLCLARCKIILNNRILIKLTQNNFKYKIILIILYIFKNLIQMLR